MAKRKNRGIAVLTMLMLGLSIIVLGLLADTRPASASDEDCLLLVLDTDRAVDLAPAGAL